VTILTVTVHLPIARVEAGEGGVPVARSPLGCEKNPQKKMPAGEVRILETRQRKNRLNVKE
jgi:hypothetical protein